MTAADFRRVALSFPDAVESAHMGHPDFRVGGKIFASLGAPSDGCGMVKLTPAEQAPLVRDHPEVFQPASGAWGRSGCTTVQLKAARVPAIRKAMAAAWRRTAPKELVRQHDRPS